MYKVINNLSTVYSSTYLQFFLVFVNPVSIHVQFNSIKQKHK